MMFCLVRTDDAAKPQEGISFLLIDMHAPGVEVRPIVTLDGGREINTVYLSDVQVPVENRVGEENRGWTCAKFLLGHERFGIARIAASKARLAWLRDIARAHPAGGGRLAEDADFMREVAETEIALRALEHCELRALMNAERGAPPGMEGEPAQDHAAPTCNRRSPSCSCRPWASTPRPGSPRRRNGAGTRRCRAPTTRPDARRPTSTCARRPSTAGSNEIQRNILAKMVLGL